MARNKYGVKPGEIYYCSWGYDQTQVEFYLVVRVTPSKAEIVPIVGTTVEEGGRGGNRVVANSEYVTREWDVLTGIDTRRDPSRPSKLCTVTTGRLSKPELVLESGQHWAQRWEGESLHVTDPHGGH